MGGQGLWKQTPISRNQLPKRQSDLSTGYFSRALVGPPGRNAGGTGSLTSGPEVCPESSRGSAWLSASSLAVPPEEMLPSSDQAPKCSPLPSCWRFTPQTSSPVPWNISEPTFPVLTHKRRGKWLPVKVSQPPSQRPGRKTSCAPRAVGCSTMRVPPIAHPPSVPLGPS